MTASVRAAIANNLALAREHLSGLASQHACSRHPLFDYLRTNSLRREQAAALLRNYDAHATVLRRLLLKAATIMPEPAVTFILENVRNEYGNGQPERRHQLQLKSLAEAAGVTNDIFENVPIALGVREYIRRVVPLYSGLANAQGLIARGIYRPAVAAGAITATEVMALEEFRAMQSAFRHAGLADHIWFDHVNVEAEHADESLALALFFVEHHGALDSVVLGMSSVLDANCLLYDGLLHSINQNRIKTESKPNRIN
jgi:hypothetical protein